MVAGTYRLDLVLAVTWFIVSCIKAEAVEFISKPSNITVEVGDTAIFPCNVVNLDKAHRVAWMSGVNSRLLSIDGHTLSSNNHVIVTIDPRGGYELHINKVKVTDAGAYKCTVTSDPIIEQISTLRVTSGKHKRKKRT